jgi:hypothetical protein
MFARGDSRHLMLLAFPVLRSLFVAALALCGALAAYVLCIFMRRRIAVYRSPLQNVPGPENAHWFKGNFADVREPDSTRLQEEWVRTYGHVLKFYSTFGVRLFFLFLFAIVVRRRISMFFVEIFTDVFTLIL